MAEQTQDKQFKGVKKFTYRGLQLEELVKLPMDKLVEQFRARQRRRISNQGEKVHAFQNLMKKIRKSKKETLPGEKPKPVKTHQRNTIVVPEMVGSIVGVYNGRQFSNVEIKFDMIGRYLGEFSLTYKPTRHGKPGVGATKGSQHTD
ncbi:unnamed protein product [Paramecium primaurelia]|uniref:40s ribosomal protein S15, putative n=5 Tax=Paramecium TaxID=5884 RepID=Q6BFE0_PARTE|nr:40s ribosomal protein S15 [Paramecium tetraurelia strain d4-2]XP_001423002.1 uncharacterized protein GSPATT00000039001 [Paramecium tetraurelia]XP_001426539.1 uncharacterized protein GSPATT00029772001 [Paramecium tetraurelia]XP_001437902.1 uncharacterized protein GSPATT00007640001 [Paramecium tetraurelia]XP_001438725.1 uncharacterized protein GSPATT00001042001 [Paramecium tetraurelia]XP_001439811.1 uncharacterized protein GSPATT00008856001 [Paramecium tetraurelia]XP_001455317.1 uncharacteri|eukprot:XP_001423002.1 hypothetical protein (macronuclear) [Paramecium tetraurelia strain d4-2]